MNGAIFFLSAGVAIISYKLGFSKFDAETTTAFIIGAGCVSLIHAVMK